MGWLFYFAVIGIVMLAGCLGSPDAESLQRQQRQAARKLGGAVTVLAGTPKQLIVALRFFNRKLEAADVAVIKQSWLVAELDLQSSRLDDAWFPAISQLQGLRALSLSDTKTTDQRLAMLFDSGPLVSLRELDLHATEVTDDGIELLKNAPMLNQLDLSETQLTDRGLASLHSLSRLRLLKVTTTGVTLRGLDRLKKALPKLSVQSDQEPTANDPSAQSQ